jgi:pyruvate dehydrogenase E2 component (dihydrolipoamide acetyltransferase)
LKVEDSEDIAKIPADTSFRGEHDEDQSSESAAQSFEVDAAEQSPALRHISPTAKMLIKEHGLDISLLKASGPRGTLLKGDVLAALKSGTASSSAKEKTVPATPSPQPAHDSQAQTQTASQKSDTFEDMTNTQIRKVLCLTTYSFLFHEYILL